MGHPSRPPRSVVPMAVVDTRARVSNFLFPALLITHAPLSLHDLPTKTANCPSAFRDLAHSQVAIDAVPATVAFPFEPLLLPIRLRLESEPRMTMSYAVKFVETPFVRRFCPGALGCRLHLSEIGSSACEGKPDLLIHTLFRQVWWV